MSMLKDSEINCNSLDYEGFCSKMRDILMTKTGAYPLYFYFFRFLINENLYKKREYRTLSYGLKGYSITSRTLIKKVKFYAKKVFNSKRAKKVDILFLSRYRPTKINTSEIIESDYLFNSVISEICKNPLKPKLALATLETDGKRYTDDRVYNFNLMDFLSLRIIFKSIFRPLLLLFKYKVISRKLLGIQKVTFDKFFTFSHLVYVHLLSCCLYQMIQNLKPIVIVVNDDVGRLKPLNFLYKMVVLQSALMIEDKEKYWNQLHSNFGTEDGILSDCFCVSGSHDKSIKEKYSFDTKKVIMTGQPRFDKIIKASKVYDKNKIREKFGLPKDKKILLWATQTHGLSREENKKNIDAMYYAANSLRDLQLVIKLHPEEDQKPLLYKNHSYSPIILGGNNGIDELLYVSDLFITKSSTSAIEASILNIPTLILNLSNELNPYIEKGVALGVYNREELIPAIKSLLYNEKVRKKLAKARENFVYDYTYLQDGRASERVANIIIEQMIDEEKRNKKESKQVGASG